MKKIFRYSGIAALSVSLIMLSMGSIPQTYAGSSGSVPSSMVLTVTCGTLPSGQIDWGTGVVINQVLDTSNTGPLTAFTIDAIITNNGIGRSFVSMNVGTDSVTGPNGGGYANDFVGVLGGVTHIAAADIQLGLGDLGTTPFVVAMVSGPTSTPVGFVDSNTFDVLDAIVTVNGINLPAASETWVLTIDVFNTDCQVI